MAANQETAVTSGAWNAARQQRRERRSAPRPRIADAADDELDRLGYLAHLMRRSYQRPWPPPPPLHVIARARGQEQQRDDDTRHTPGRARPARLASRPGEPPQHPATTTEGTSA